MDNNLPKAGFGIRFFAYLTDYLILGIPTLLFFTLTGLGNGGFKKLLVSLVLFLVLFGVFNYLWQILYFAYFTSVFGATLGKLIAGLTVVDEKGNHLTFRRAVFRFVVGYPVSFLLFGLGFFWIMKDPQKQGWHDQLTGSYVLKKRVSGLVTVLVSLVLLLVTAGFLVKTSLVKLANNTTLKTDWENLQSVIEESFSGKKEDQQLDLQEGDDSSFYDNFPSEKAYPEL